MYRLPACCFLLIAFFSCSHPQTETGTDSTTDLQDRNEIVRQFIYGLWSLDSGNLLTNEGFLFSADGRLDFIASEFSGTWELPSTDTMLIKWADYNEEKITTYRIDSLSDSRMFLSDGKKNLKLRRVPFGVNKTETVLNGFAGTLTSGETKDYDITLPSVKKIRIRLKSENVKIKFSMYDGTKEIASNIQDWTGIVIRGGKYKVSVILPHERISESVDFDLKVMSY